MASHGRCVSGLEVPPGLVLSEAAAEPVTRFLPHWSAGLGCITHGQTLTPAKAHIYLMHTFVLHL